MSLSAVCWFLLLCGHFVNAENIFHGSSSHHVWRRAIKPKMNISEVVATKLTVSPTWFTSVGDTVVINCTTRVDKGNYSDKFDLQLVWNKMSPGDRTKKVVMSRRASEGISYVLSAVTHEHQGIYTCDEDGSLPDDVYVHDWHQILWVADASPNASIDVVSHNRSQFFYKEIFTLSCQLPDSHSQWKMKRFDIWDGIITECPDQVSSDRRLSCTLESEYPKSNGLFWCENLAGERSNALNISASSVTSVALESPARPVFEGEDVMLRCLHRDRKTKKITSDFLTVFFKNENVIRTPNPKGSIPRFAAYGNTTLRAVTKADEGLYKCLHEDGRSHGSWITVIARPDKDAKKREETRTETPKM